MNHKPGPVRLRSDEYEAEILCVDMGGVFPILGRYRKRGFSIWESQNYRHDGRIFPTTDSLIDIMPPKLSRDEVIMQCMVAADFWLSDDAKYHFGKALDHYDTLRREGLCDDD